MRALPEDFDVPALTAALLDGWEVKVARAEYAAVGGGSYHWLVTGTDGTLYFATVDDLDRKPWLGSTRESVFAGLSDAFDTAAALRERGLEFVVAPIPAILGETARRDGLRYAIALFPFVGGQAGTFGQYDSAERPAIVAMLAELHQATVSTARPIDLELPGRRDLEQALRELDDPWTCGPLAEPARRALADHASDLADLLALSDRLGATLPDRSDWVVTHGEPHAANVIHTGQRHVLVDWDTVGRAPPERDLWMLVRNAPETATGYAEATGHRLAKSALDFFRLRWDLADIASFSAVLRSPHRRNADTVKAYDGLTYCLATRDQWAEQL